MTVNMRKEQVLLLVVVLLGGWLAYGYWNDGYRRSRPRLSTLSYKASIPDAPFLANAKNDPGLGDDIFLEPSETRPLPPRDLPFPALDDLQYWDLSDGLQYVPEAYVPPPVSKWEGQTIVWVGTHAEVVLRVEAGACAFGAVRTGTLERMEADLAIASAAAFAIVGWQALPTFPLARSTALYPEVVPGPVPRLM